MKIEYHPLTTVELNDAIKHYNEQQPGLGDYLRSEVYAAIERIRDNPYLYAETRGVRRALVKRFPYSVVYRLLSTQHIRILVIRHHKRHPEYGSER
jgi:plasmid stabilization system protein ParE